VRDSAGEADAVRHPQLPREPREFASERSITDYQELTVVRPREAGEDAEESRWPTVSVPEVDLQVVGALVAGLLLVVLTRSLYYRSVFRDGYTVSPENDPYFYRYWQAELLDRSGGLADVGVLADVGRLTESRPLTHALNWWITELLGGTPGAADAVAAWAPIAGAVVLALLVYGIAVSLTREYRIALAAVVLLALTPVQVLYTSLGFLEHRLYQYVWLALLALTLVWLAGDVQRRRQAGNGGEAAAAHLRAPRSWAVSALLAVAVAASAHTWGGSPLTFVPVALYLGLRPIADVRADVPPVAALGPTLAGVGAGSLLAALLHVGLGWHEPIATAVPLLVAVGGVSVALLATVWQRLELSAAAFLATEGVVAVLGSAVFWLLRPGDVDRLRSRAGDLFGREDAAETASLFAIDNAVVFGPLSALGAGFYLALPALGIATWYVGRRYRPAWLVLVVFTWYYTLLAAIQVRFAAQLGIFVAIFGAVSLVLLLAKVELSREASPFSTVAGAKRRFPRLPADPVRGAYIVGLLGLVVVLSLVAVPGLVSPIQYSDAEVEAMVAIDEHADENGHEPYVLSRWGTNRMYNYFVSGDSRGYGYADATHRPFIRSDDPDGWYDTLSERVGYVVIESSGLSMPSTHARLFEEFGAGDDAVAHYQLLSADADIRAFVVVEGASITATADPGETVSVSTQVSVAGESFTYERRGTADEDGQVRIRVAYPGEYEVGAQTVQVTEQDVLDGARVSAEGS